MIKPASIVIIQTHVPDFRLPIFADLHRQLGTAIEIWSGDNYFTPTSGVPARNEPWSRHLTTWYLPKPVLAFQTGHTSSALQAKLVIAEFNPRLISTWILLLARKCMGRSTFLWGHLLPRAGIQSQTRFVRFVMLRLADGFIAYTYGDATSFTRQFPGKKVHVAANAVTWDADCRPGLGTARRFRVLFVARLVPEKKPMELLVAFAHAVPVLPADVVLDFIGSGRERAALVAMADKLGITTRINFHGSIYLASELRPFYEEAIAAVSPGYVGLSATQAFGFGVPMLIARNEAHSVEIELCKEGVNSAFYPSGDTAALGDLLVEFAGEPPAWSVDRNSIIETMRPYTYESMRKGFMGVLGPHLSGITHSDEPLHIAIAWIGMPYYAARAIRAARERLKHVRFTIISSRDGFPYTGIEDVVGQHIHWIQSSEPTCWANLGTEPPDLLLITSWPHAAYQSLAREAKTSRNTPVISMVDNILRYTPKQFGGFFYFRAFLRNLYSAMWVPGEGSRKFIRFLGMSDTLIYKGLYAADHDIFKSPPTNETRSGLVFVGQLIERKGVRKLAEAFIARSRAGRSTELRLVGQGPLAKTLRTQGLMVGDFLQPAELVPVYQSADALILPSLVDHWGVVGHEAALCGCILLVTKNCGCAADLVEHGVNGYVMKRTSVSEILKAWAWLDGLDPAARKRARAVSIARAVKISPERWAQTLQEMMVRFVPKDRQMRAKDVRISGKI